MKDIKFNIVDRVYNATLKGSHGIAIAQLKIMIIGVILLLFIGCGSKKTITQSDKKEKTDTELTDNSLINKKIEQENQYANTSMKERIVTMYGMQMVPVTVGKDTVKVPFSYPVEKEESRDISVSNFIWRLNVQDSIQNAIDLKYKDTINEKDKNISELKESKMIYQIALLIISIVLVVVLILYFSAKIKIGRFNI